MFTVYHGKLLLNHQLPWGIPFVFPITQEANLTNMFRLCWYQNSRSVGNIFFEPSPVVGGVWGAWWNMIKLRCYLLKLSKLHSVWWYTSWWYWWCNIIFRILFLHDGKHGSIFSMFIRCLRWNHNSFLSQTPQNYLLISSFSRISLPKTNKSPVVGVLNDTIDPLPLFALVGLSTRPLESCGFIQCSMLGLLLCLITGAYAKGIE